jgi:5-methyltetrahydropteroyltriglutamate--homocysteine methyltransferase
MMPAPRIRTTVVGSYPVPDWLAAHPSEQALVDATRVVLHTQERAGIDLVCGGGMLPISASGSSSSTSRSTT